MSDPASIDAICAKLAIGQSLRSICREMGVHEATVRYWLTSNQDAFTQSVRARELGCDALADQCIEIADGPGDPSDKRIKIDTRLRLIGKWAQHKYGEKVTVDSRSTVTHKYDLDSLGDGQLDELERILTLAERDTGSTGASELASLH